MAKGDSFRTSPLDIETIEYIRKNGKKLREEWERKFKEAEETKKKKSSISSNSKKSKKNGK